MSVENRVDADRRRIYLTILAVVPQLALPATQRINGHLDGYEFFRIDIENLGGVSHDFFSLPTSNLRECRIDRNHPAIRTRH